MSYKIAILAVLFPILVLGQIKMVAKGALEYPATTNWSFSCPNYALTGEVSVQIAKIPNGGLLKLSVLTTNPDFIIKGTVYVYLANNTIIVCTDKGNFENKDETISSYFTFTKAEIQQLKKADIQSIRFNIDGKNNKFSSQIGNFTAVNKQNQYSTAYQPETKLIPTAKEIQLLFP